MIVERQLEKKVKKDQGVGLGLRLALCWHWHCIILAKRRSDVGDAHGHGPPCVTSGERTLLSAWLKQGRDWLMLKGRAGLVL
jgi:hypothetical protein